MVIVLGLVTALAYGSADFCGGLATKRASVIQVVAGAHLTGLIGVTAASLLIGAPVGARDLLLGAVAGAFGGVGLALLYRRLALGPMHVVAPLTAVASAAVPVAWGVVTGARTGAVVWLGVGLGVVAVALVSSSPPQSHQPVTPQVVGESLLAGSGFGGFLVILDYADPAAAPWPIVGARVLTTVVLLVVLAVRARRPEQRGTGADTGTAALVVAAGGLDTLANVTFLYATAAGQLVVAAVLTSLYPVATVGLARLVLHEPVIRVQLAGLFAAVAATAFIALG